VDGSNSVHDMGFALSYVLAITAKYLWVLYWNTEIEEWQPRYVRASRVAAGQAVARRKGKKWGGSKPGWRWKVSDDQVTAIREMKASGKKITHIARSRDFHGLRFIGC